MKIVVHRQSLLADVESIVGPVRLISTKRNPVPDIKLTASVDGVSLTTLLDDANDAWVRIDLQGVCVIEPGEVDIPLPQLAIILSQVVDEEICIEADPILVIRGKDVEFALADDDCRPVPDMPVFPGKVLEFDAASLKHMIGRTVLATAGQEHSRFGATTGVLWEFDREHVSLIATDGQRLAKADGESLGEAPVDFALKEPAVVPAKVMRLLERLLGSEGRVHVGFHEEKGIGRQFMAAGGRWRVYGRLVEGRFPNWRQVVPTKFTAIAKFEVGPFLNAVRLAAIMTGAESERVIFNFAKDKLAMTSRDYELGQASVEMPVRLEGADIEVWFKPSMLIEMLEHFHHAAMMTMEMRDTTLPVMFRCGADYLYVVVPLVSSDQVVMDRAGRERVAKEKAGVQS